MNSNAEAPNAMNAVNALLGGYTSEKSLRYLDQRQHASRFVTRTRIRVAERLDICAKLCYGAQW